MYYEFSHYFLLLAISTAFTLLCLQNRCIIASRLKHNNIFWIISFYSIIITSSFFGTITSYACSDFSVYNILTNCSLRSPLFYKISATWSNHEGSLLLWCWLLSFYGFLFCILTRHTSGRWSDSRHSINADHFVSYLRKSCKGTALLAQPNVQPKECDLAWSLLCVLRNKLFIEQQQRITTNGAVIYSFIILFFASFLVYTSNPFLKVTFPCINYLAELNPVLQDPVLAIHPPCIYAGYAASAISFSLCLSKINYDIKRNILRTLLSEVRLVADLLKSKPFTSREQPKLLTNHRASCLTQYQRALFEPQPQKDIEERSNTWLRTSSSLWSTVKTYVGLSSVITVSPQRSFSLGRSNYWTKAAAAPVSQPGKVRRYVPASEPTYVGSPQGSEGKQDILDKQKDNLITFNAQQVRRKPYFKRLEEVRSLAITDTWPQIRFWILACWSFLTFGILLGSWWAYHELGWGGWWFWDPVENASLMPWLLATACIHSVAKRHFVSATLYLNFSAFVLSILGTFFVRSGLLASVHSFATDSTRGLYLLFFLLSITTISVLKFCQYQRSVRTQVLLKTQIDQILSLQNLFFCFICIVVLCGTTAPLAFQWFCNRDVTTGAPFYNGTLIPLFTSVFFVLVYTHYTQLKFDSNKKACCAPWVDEKAKSSLFHRKFKQNARRGRHSFLFKKEAASKSRKRAEQKSLWFQKKKTKSYKAFSRLPRSLSARSFLQPARFFKKSKKHALTLPANPRFADYAPFVFCILFCVFVNLICFNLLGLCFLESIYGTICFLLICSFLLSTNKIAAHHATMLPKVRSNSLQPSRLISLLMLPHTKTLSMKIAHIGIVLFITGIIISNTFKVQFTQLMHYGDLIRLGPQICCLRSIDHAYAPTYHSICGNIIVYPQGSLEADKLLNKNTDLIPVNFDISQYASQEKSFAFPLACLCVFPEKRFFFSNPELTTTKVAIHTNLFTDIYALIGTGSMDTGWYTTIMKLPFIFCIWLGFLLATIGGAIALKRQLKKSKLIWV